MNPPRSELLTTAQVAEELHLVVGTLQNWRVHGQGPRWVKLGKGRNARVVYERGALQDWLETMKRGGGREGQDR